MKPQLLKVTTDMVHSFSTRRDVLPDINNHWHYHPEVELLYIKSGNGTQFIGDSIKPFQAGDIVIVGANLPHYWRFDDRYFEPGNNLSVDVYAIHFTEVFWGDTFLDLPENKSIKTVLEQARLGIALTTNTENIGKLIEQAVTTEGVYKLIKLMEVLTAINAHKQQTQLASLGFQYSFQDGEKDRINAIYNYTLANFKNKIKLEEIAAVANVSPNSFCRFFKSRSHKTYSQFINEIRVGHACKLLIDNQLNIKEICFESGFYNFASFHKYFRAITGKSPLSYQKTYIKKV